MHCLSATETAVQVEAANWCVAIARTGGFYLRCGAAGHAWCAKAGRLMDHQTVDDDESRVIRRDQGVLTQGIPGRCREPCSG